MVLCHMPQWWIRNAFPMKLQCKYLWLHYKPCQTYAELSQITYEPMICHLLTSTWIPVFGYPWLQKLWYCHNKPDIITLFDFIAYICEWITIYNCISPRRRWTLFFPFYSDLWLANLCWAELRCKIYIRSSQPWSQCILCPTHFCVFSAPLTCN